MTKEEMQALLAKLNKAKIGGEDGAGRNAMGDDLSIKSLVKFGIPTRIPELDLSIGRAGYPAGRVVEFYGLPMSGKTTAALHAIAQAQRMGGAVFFIDTELSFDPDRAAECGVDPTNLGILEAKDIEEIFEKIEFLLGARGEPDGKPFLICIDSITGVQTRTDAARKIKEGSRVGENARVIRHGLQRLNNAIADTQSTVIFINHSTALIGNTSPWARKSDSAGGNGIKFYASIRMEFKNAGDIKEKEDEEDTESKAKVRRGMKSIIELTKNKVAQTGNPLTAVELTENGFDFYLSLWAAYEKIGAMESVNAKEWFFAPTKTRMAKKNWQAFVDGFEGKDGKVLGVDGFYKHFLTMATNDGWIKPYGERYDSGNVNSPAPTE
jgi:protein RecA